MEFIQKVASVTMIAFVLSSMLAMGLGLTGGEIIAPLRRARLVTLTLVGNFVLMPAAARGLTALLRLDEPLGVGLLLLGTAAGAPFLPKLAQLAKGDLAFAVGAMVLLMVITVGYLPVVLPLFLPGVSVNPAKIARSLFLLMLLPLAGALAVRAWFPDVAGRTKPFLDKFFKPEPYSAGRVDHDRERQQRSGSVRHARYSRRNTLHCDWVRCRLVSRRTGGQHPPGAGVGHRATQHCGSVGRR